MADMRSDPTDTGGLFVGRRPGTAPIHFRTLPQRGRRVRRCLDGSLAGFLLGSITVLSLFCWGPIPLACLWLGSRADYLTGSVALGLLVSFVALFVLSFGTLSILRRLDWAWILARRAAGHDQRGGALGRIFAATAAVCALAFALWFFVIHGPGYGAPDLRVP
jgi:predicted secreted protein